MKSAKLNKHKHCIIYRGCILYYLSYFLTPGLPVQLSCWFITIHKTCMLPAILFLCEQDAADERLPLSRHSAQTLRTHHIHTRSLCCITGAQTESQTDLSELGYSCYRFVQRRDFWARSVRDLRSILILCVWFTLQYKFGMSVPQDRCFVHALLWPWFLVLRMTSRPKEHNHLCRPQFFFALLDDAALQCYLRRLLSLTALLRKGSVLLR